MWWALFWPLVFSHTNSSGSINGNGGLSLNGQSTTFAPTGICQQLTNGFWQHLIQRFNVPKGSIYWMEIWYTYMLMKDLSHSGKVMVKLGALSYAIGIHINFHQIQIWERWSAAALSPIKLRAKFLEASTHIHFSELLHKTYFRPPHTKTFIVSTISLI